MFIKEFRISLLLPLDDLFLYMNQFRYEVTYYLLQTLFITNVLEEAGSEQWRAHSNGWAETHKAGIPTRKETGSKP